MGFDRTRFFQEYRNAFGSLNQDQVAGLNFLLSAFEGDPRWSDVRHVAYALASIRHETAHTYEPISERGSAAYLSKYWTNASIRRSLGNTEPADAQRYKGRGFIQITGRSNYTRFGIADNPDKALEAQPAFDIMTRGMHEGLFTGKRLKDYINGDKVDYVQARRIINGLDKAKEIAAYARGFEEMLRAAKSVNDGSAEVITNPTDADKGVTTGDKLPEDIAGTPPPAPAVEVKASSPSLLSKMTSIGVPAGVLSAIGGIWTFVQGMPPWGWAVLGGVFVVALVLGAWLYNESMKRSQQRTNMVMAAAADKNANNLRLI